MKKFCICDSQKIYAHCCQPLLEGAYPSNALALMRSRYSAYTLSKADYIIHTTHPLNPLFQNDDEKWRREILHFCQNTIFEKLEILEFQDGEKSAEVTFVARLRQNKREVKLKERSLFEKVGPQWLYRSGIVS